MIELELNAFWHNDESSMLDDLGIETEPGEDCVLKIHTFYHIDNIRPAENTNYCVIVSGNDEVVVPHTYAYVKKKIKEQMQPKFLTN